MQARPSEFEYCPCVGPMEKHELEDRRHEHRPLIVVLTFEPAWFRTETVDCLVDRDAFDRNGPARAASAPAHMLDYADRKRRCTAGVSIDSPYTSRRY